jgi:hypothetical protein
MSDNVSLNPAPAAVNEPASKQLSHNELRLNNELRLAHQRQTVLELEVLNSRDHALGRAAEIGEWRYRLIRQAAMYEQRLRDRETHEANHKAHIARLETALQAADRAMQQNFSGAGELRRELNALQASTTWRVGRFLMLPIRTLRRVIGR